MPELNDYVRLYFPGKKEEEGLASSAVRKNIEKTETNKLTKPEVKYFRTKDGKELKFSPEEIVITGKDEEIFIRLHDKEGIEIISKEPIKFKTSKDLSIDAKQKVVISAKEKIDMKCKSSEITMDGKTIIKGGEVKSN